MRPSIDRPVIEEPWAKRLRMTRSRSIKPGQDSDHLPSPKPTNPSSTDDLPASSSGDHKAKSTQKQIQSLRERLVPLPKKPAPAFPVNSTQAANKKPASRPSVAPFFQRIEAAFRDKPQAAAKTNHANTAVTRKPARSPSPDAEDLIQQLKEHYLRTATTLHKQATLRLSQAHTDLTHKTTQSLTKQDEPFLASAEAQIKKLSQPLDKFRIRSQQRVGGGGGSDGAGSDGNDGEGEGVLRCEEKSVGELVKRAEEQVREFEEEVGRLWREWADAEGEVGRILEGVVAAAASTNGMDGKGGEEEGKEMLRRFGEVVEREIGEAEEQVVELGEEAVAMMKEIEKDFRKATLPDLHTFFQSIDEP